MTMPTRTTPGISAHGRVPLSAAETDAPETHVPATHVPATNVPETHAPEIHAPATQPPETHGPQIHGPQTHAVADPVVDKNHAVVSDVSISTLLHAARGRLKPCELAGKSPKRTRKYVRRLSTMAACRY
jgi:hypothetical protein